MDTNMDEIIRRKLEVDATKPLPWGKDRVWAALDISHTKPRKEKWWYYAAAAVAFLIGIAAFNFQSPHTVRVAHKPVHNTSPVPAAAEPIERGNTPVVSSVVRPPAEVRSRPLFIPASTPEAGDIAIAEIAAPDSMVAALPENAVPVRPKKTVRAIVGVVPDNATSEAETGPRKMTTKFNLGNIPDPESYASGREPHRVRAKLN